jgi:nitrite reductase (NADH) small subunit
VCPLADLDQERGVAALIGTMQVAVFRVDGEGDGLYAIDNRDPASGANVLARGIVGSRGEALYVASPMHRHRFDLRSGRCLDDDNLSVVVWAVRTCDQQVQVRAPRV